MTERERATETALDLAHLRAEDAIRCGCRRVALVDRADVASGVVRVGHSHVLECLLLVTFQSAEVARGRLVGGPEVEGERVEVGVEDLEDGPRVGDQLMWEREMSRRRVY